MIFVPSNLGRICVCVVGGVFLPDCFLALHAKMTLGKTYCGVFAALRAEVVVKKFRSVIVGDMIFGRVSIHGHVCECKPIKSTKVRI